MSLEPGTKLAHYDVVEPIGAGGMGAVYRARDTKLDRDVAIKVLPEELSRDPERLARFKREAKLLASLNHPGIATLHGFEKVDEQAFLVMELVEGETLADRITRGAIPLDETIEIFHLADLSLRDVRPRGDLSRMDHHRRVSRFVAALRKPARRARRRVGRRPLTTFGHI